MENAYRDDEADRDIVEDGERTSEPPSQSQRQTEALRLR